MKRIGYSLACLTSFAALALSASVALAAPAINSAVLETRVFNGCPESVLNTANNYPASIYISDDAADTCTAYSNLHDWRFSEDGTNPAVFNNADLFRMAADLVVDGPGQGEAALQITAWWGQTDQGRLNVRTTDGEIAMFGGFLPYFNFTNTFGIFYTKGTPIHIEFNYDPHSNTVNDPATLECKIAYQGQLYTSGVLPFNNCNPSDPPQYGCYGIGNDSRAGGMLQCLWQAGYPTDQEINATWNNIEYSPDYKPTPTESATWGRIKTMYR